MQTVGWKILLPLYLAYILAFPAGMLLVESRPPAGPTICAFRLTTGLDCPACGLTRAFRAMGRLDVMQAFRYNPLGPLVFLAAVVYWIYALGMLIMRGRIRLPRWWEKHKNRFSMIAVAVFLLVGFIRVGYEIGHPPPPPQAPQLTFGSGITHLFGR